MQSQTTVQNPENLFATLTAKERFHMVVPSMIEDNDKRELHLPMVVLTTRETNEVEVAAYQETLAAFKGVAPKNDEATNFNNVYENNLVAWTVFKSVRLPSDLKKQFFLSKQQVEDQYTVEQLGILANAQLSVKLNQPHLKHLSLGEEDASEKLIQDIIAAGRDNDFFLNGYTTHSLKALIQYLVFQLQSSRKDNGSSGTLSSETMKSE